ncbi:MAG: GGDEF domain-containing protein [Planctomycetota bacterium]|jgi:diguanylate cyclase (GGDEF)-like protein
MKRWWKMNIECSNGKRILVHCIIGVGIGYLILHPASMYIHTSFEEGSHAGINLILMAFTLSHIPMALFFMLLGGLIGFLYGMITLRMAGLYMKVREISITDPLTGIYNRRYLMEALEREVSRAKRYSHKLSFMMIDVDHFKCYNDRYGHQMGDTILRIIADHMRNATRKNDLIARYGGEEFSVVLPETGKKEALQFAERLRQEVQKNPYLECDSHPDGRITISIGVAEMPADAENEDKLISLADEALYRAKQAGRNRVCAAGRRTEALTTPSSRSVRDRKLPSNRQSAQAAF